MSFQQVESERAPRTIYETREGELHKINDYLVKSTGLNTFYESKKWVICDRFETLVMLYPSEDAGEEREYLRGLILDLPSTGRAIVVCPANPKVSSPTVKTLVSCGSELTITGYNGEKETKIAAEGSSFVAMRYHEGVTLRIFLWNGEFFFASSKKIDTSRSSWRGGIVFKSAYFLSGGRNPSFLFEKNKKYSNKIFTSVVCHPDLLSASKIRLLKGYVLQLPVRWVVWNRENPPYDPEEIDWIESDSANLNTSKYSTLSVPSSEGKVFDTNFNWSTQVIPEIPIAAHALTLDEANQFLKSGFYPNSRVGEALYIVRAKTGETDQFVSGLPVAILRSNSYAFRRGIYVPSDKSSSLLLRYAELLSEADYISRVKDVKKFERDFECLRELTHSDLLQMFGEKQIITSYLNKPFLGFLKTIL